MTICPKCSAENRPEAAFCVRCGTILLAQPAPPVPPEQSVAIHKQVFIQHPVAIPGFTMRPEGAIFGERFRYNTLLYQDEHENHYAVTEISQPNSPCVRICTNPDCQTIVAPSGPDTEKFCIYCGHPLEERSPLFLLQESDNDKFNSLKPVIDLHLVHPHIHPPIAAFQQDLSGSVRYCLVTPLSQDMPAQSEISQVLEWGEQLAEALDYLHIYGIVLGEQLDPSSIGMLGNKVAWRDFSTVRILPMLTDREKINNIRLLALSMYSWMTGRTSYSVDPYMPPRLNELFQRALVGEGFTSGSELAHQIDLARAAGLSRLNLDYLVGRRTHSGKARKNNEDSLLSFELSRIQQGNTKPMGLFGIADGMGGHATGELASSLVIQTIAQKAAFDLATLQDLSDDDYRSWIKQIIQAANRAVFDARQSAGNDMGSTLALVLLHDDQAHLAYLGDSRIYLINKTSIQQLSTDHSLVQHMVTTGVISSDEARYHPQRNVIYRSLGEKPEGEADYSTRQLNPGDRVLLCSDGLNGMLEDQVLHQVILEANSPQAACDRLIEAANLAGGEDNISVIVVEVISV